MGLKSVADDRQMNAEGTISFGEKYVESDSFKSIFREGMALVEEAAGYLEGPGRAPKPRPWKQNSPLPTPPKACGSDHQIDAAGILVAYSSRRQ